MRTSIISTRFLSAIFFASFAIFYSCGKPSAQSRVAGDANLNGDNLELAPGGVQPTQAPASSGNSTNSSGNSGPQSVGSGATGAAVRSDVTGIYITPSLLIPAETGLLNNSIGVKVNYTLDPIAYGWIVKREASGSFFVDANIPYKLNLNVLDGANKWSMNPVISLANAKASVLASGYFGPKGNPKGQFSGSAETILNYEQAFSVGYSLSKGLNVNIDPSPLIAINFNVLQFQYSRFPILASLFPRIHDRLESMAKSMIQDGGNGAIVEFKNRIPKLLNDVEKNYIIPAIVTNANLKIKDFMASFASFIEKQKGVGASLTSSADENNLVITISKAVTGGGTTLTPAPAKALNTSMGVAFNEATFSDLLNEIFANQTNLLPVDIANLFCTRMKILSFCTPIEKDPIAPLLPPVLQVVNFSFGDKPFAVNIGVDSKSGQNSMEFNASTTLSVVATSPVSVPFVPGRFRYDVPIQIGFTYSVDSTGLQLVRKDLHTTLGDYKCTVICGKNGDVCPTNSAITNSIVEGILGNALPKTIGLPFIPPLLAAFDIDKLVNTPIAQAFPGGAFTVTPPKTTGLSQIYFKPSALYTDTNWIVFGWKTTTLLDACNLALTTADLFKVCRDTVGVCQYVGWDGGAKKIVLTPCTTVSSQVIGVPTTPSAPSPSPSASPSPSVPVSSITATCPADPSAPVVGIPPSAPPLSVQQ